MAGPEIRAVGFRELRRDLKQAGAQFPKELQQTNKRVVEDIVVPAAQKKGRETRTNLAGRSTRLGSRGVASIRALASQSRAQVAMGGNSVPEAMGHEWGANRLRQFPKKNADGYILWPTVEEKRDEIIDEYRDSLDRLARRANL